jgi:hypothetical protein
MANARVEAIASAILQFDSATAVREYVSSIALEN